MDRFCPIVEDEKIILGDSPMDCLISVFPAYDDNGEKVKPTIISSEVINSDEDFPNGIMHNNTLVNQGDLAMTHNDSAGDSVAKIVNNSDLEISPLDDDALKYDREDFDLIYTISDGTE